MPGQDKICFKLWREKSLNKISLALSFKSVDVSIVPIGLYHTLKYFNYLFLNTRHLSFLKSLDIGGCIPIKLFYENWLLTVKKLLHFWILGMPIIISLLLDCSFCLQVNIWWISFFLFFWVDISKIEKEKQKKIFFGLAKCQLLNLKR